MTKPSLPRKTSAANRPLPKPPAPARSPALPRDIPAAKRRVQPDDLADGELDRPDAGVDPTLPENTAQGVPGHQVKEPPSEDEDAEGRSTTEQLIDAGAQEAELDKFKQANHAASRGKRN